MRMRALSSAPAAVRMRLHRKRRREGTHYVRIPLESFEIEGLIRLKVLPKAHREDADALQAAVLTLVYQALDGAGEFAQSRRSLRGRGRDSRIYAEPCPERIEHRYELRNW